MYPAEQQGMYPADRVSEQQLECPKCGTCAGSEEYYNNSDNICYLTYCTKCVHERGVYINLEKHEEKHEELQRMRTAAEKWRRNAEKLRRSREDASSPYQVNFRTPGMTSSLISHLVCHLPPPPVTCSLPRSAPCVERGSLARGSRPTPPPAGWKGRPAQVAS